MVAVSTPPDYPIQFSSDGTSLYKPVPRWIGRTTTTIRDFIMPCLKTTDKSDDQHLAKNEAQVDATDDMKREGMSRRGVLTEAPKWPLGGLLWYHDNNTRMSLYDASGGPMYRTEVQLDTKNLSGCTSVWYIGPSEAPKSVKKIYRTRGSLLVAS